MRFSKLLQVGFVVLILHCNKETPKEQDPPPTDLDPVLVSLPPEDCYEKQSCAFWGDPNRAVFVTLDGSDNNLGTQESPLRTVSMGVQKAKALGLQEVFVSVGEYTDNVLLQDGVSIYGGYDASKNWTYTKNSMTDIVGGLPSALPLSLVVLDGQQITSPTKILGFKIVGKDNEQPGGNSYALRCQTCPGLYLRFDTLIAGRAGNGQNGTNGISGINGEPGLHGNVDSSCSGYITFGGIGGMSPLGFSGGTGGNGGGAFMFSAYPGDAGQAGVIGISGGWGGFAVDPFSRDGGSGMHGLAGIKGSSGIGGTGYDIIDGDIIAGNGFPGTSGTSGYGGGGGGGGGGKLLSLYSGKAGGSGGGGGAGGLPGQGGMAGKGGGSSVAIALVNSTGFTILDSKLETQTAGNGGRGGNGGLGGHGGIGGFGLSPTTTCGTSGKGGNGGNGGKGGGGGSGGGGGGGVSCAVFMSETSVILPESVVVKLGEAGKGGLGGVSLDEEMQGGSGADGIANHVCLPDLLM